MVGVLGVWRCRGLGGHDYCLGWVVKGWGSVVGFGVWVGAHVSTSPRWGVFGFVLENVWVGGWVGAGDNETRECAYLAERGHDCFGMDALDVFV